MRRLTLRIVTHSLAVLAVTATLFACSRTDEGNVQVQVPDVDVKVGRDTVTIPAPNLPNIEVGARRDTITTPTVGTKRTEVQRPTVDAKRP
jgi:hypothetical protein